MAFRLQPLVQQQQLRALPGPVDALDDDQFSGVGVGSAWVEGVDCSCGIVLRDDGKLHAAAEHAFKEIRPACGGPGFQLRIARHVHGDGDGGAESHIEGADDRKMRPIQAIGDPKQRGQDPHDSFVLGERASNSSCFS